MSVHPAVDRPGLPETSRLHNTGRPLRLVLLVLAIGFLLCIAAGLPGHLSTDSVIQLHEGRRRVYESFNPPVMSFLLGALDRILPGTSLFVLGVMVLLFGSLVATLLLRPRTSWAAVPVAVLLVMTPQYLIYPGIVWKDVLFATSSIGAFVSLGMAVRRLDTHGLRTGYLLPALALFTLAALARQNGLVVVLLAGASLSCVLWKQGRRRALFAGAGGVAAVLVCMQFTNAALALVDRSENGSKISIGLRVLQHYDIVGAVAHDPDVDLSALQADPELERRLREQADDIYSPERVDTLARAPELMADLGALPAESVSAQWRSLMLEQTSTYLSQRWGAFRQVLFTPEITSCLPLHVGVDGPPQVIEALGITAEQDAQDLALYSYAARFFGTPLYSHALFACVAALVSAVLLLRREGADIIIAGLELSALAVTASYYVVSIACDYRYLYFLDAAALLGLLYLVSDPPGRSTLDSMRRWTARPSPDQVSPERPGRASEVGSAAPGAEPQASPSSASPTSPSRAQSSAAPGG